MLNSSFISKMKTSIRTALTITIEQILGMTPFYIEEHFFEHLEYARQECIRISIVTPTIFFNLHSDYEINRTCVIIYIYIWTSEEKCMGNIEMGIQVFFYQTLYPRSSCPTHTHISCSD